MNEHKEKALRFYCNKICLPFEAMKILEEAGQKSDLSKAIDIALNSQKKENMEYHKKTEVNLKKEIAEMRAFLNYSGKINEFAMWRGTR